MTAAPERLSAKGLLRWLAILACWLGMVMNARAESAAAAGTPPDGWSVLALGGAVATLRVTDGVVWLDYDTPKGEGHIMLRKAMATALPERYILKFRLKMPASSTDLEIRLTDPGARNVWGWRDYAFAGLADWQALEIPSRAIEYAWGPSRDRLTQIDGVEWIITPGAPGKGRLAIGAVSIAPQPRLAAAGKPPAIRASSTLHGHPPEQAIDPSPDTFWHSATRAAEASLTLDFGGLRELGGLDLDWCGGDHAQDYQVRLAADGVTWRTVKHLRGRRGGRDTLYLPNTVTRYLQLALSNSARRQGFCLRRLNLLPAEAAASPNAFFTRLARQSSPGDYPKYYLGQQAYFTVIGPPDSPDEALMNDAGTLEVGRGRYTIEPFLFRDGRLLTWRDVALEQTLEQGDLPVPTVRWQAGATTLRITGLASGGAEQTLFARYQLENTAASPAQLRLYLAIRPFQVNPPWQSLNMRGGFSPIYSASWTDGAVHVNQRLAAVPLNESPLFGAMTFDEGELVDTLRTGQLPRRQAAQDATGIASAALAYDLMLPAGDMREVYLAVPLGDSGALRQALKQESHPAMGPERLRQAEADWTRRLAGPVFTGPPEVQRLAGILRTYLAYILIHRDPPAFYPGSRAYARAWIRDGASIASALLAMGHSQEVREFITWYASYQRPDGTIPCCVDRRGPESVPENDSHGEFIFTLAEYYRYTHDVAFLRQLWPAVMRTVGAIEALRQQRMTPEYQSGPKALFFGLMPESISHEGYAGNPVHAFWDDFWTLRGLKDAVELAEALGDQTALDRCRALRDAFRQSLYAALERTIATKQLAYLPGSVELGDFDANATAVGVTIAGEAEQLPQSALRRTFDDYMDYVRKRRDGQQVWDAYTPYEVRSVEALVRLGRRDQALELLDFLLMGQRPAAWHQWAEVVWRDPEAPKFIGDMPHGWIGAEFIRAFRALFVFERESDRALVLAAGLPERWLAAGGAGVEALPTPYGQMTYRIRQTGPGEIRASLTGKLSSAAGPLVLQPPLPRPLRGVTLNGQPVTGFTAQSVKIGALPAEVELRY